MTTSQPEEIALVQLFELPSLMAHALQIAHTADALGHCGLKVHLGVRMPGGSQAAARACLGELLGRELHEGVQVQAITVAHKGLAGALYRRQLFQLLGRPGVAFYGRQRRQTLWLLRARSWRRFRRTVNSGDSPIAFEFHNLEHVLARESSQPSDRAQDSKKAQRIQAEERRLANEVDRLIAISEPLAMDLQATFGLAELPAVVPDGVDLEHFQRARVGQEPKPSSVPLQSGDAAFRLIYAGSYHLHKGVRFLLDVLESLPQRFTLQLVGSHPRREWEELQALARSRSGIAERVHFVGQCSQAEVAHQLAAADAILLPAAKESRSSRYTSPLKLFESMAVGVPIVAADVPSLASVLRDGETACLVQAHSVSAWSRAIQGLQQKPEVAAELGKRAALAAQDFSWKCRAKRIVQLLCQ